MGHTLNAKEEVYRALAERLHKNPVGTPVNEDLLAILYRLYTEGEAMVGSRFPLVPMTLEQIAGLTGMQAGPLTEVLESMADKGLVIDIPRRNVTYYTLAPMIIGFFEHTFMRVRDEINMRELAELFAEYFQRPEVGRELVSGDTKLFQTLVYERLIPLAVETEVLNYERASDIIRQSGGGALSLCSCRHMAGHLGKSCAVNAPLDVCTSLGETAQWLVRRGMGRAATVDELLRVLDETEKLGLVHLGDNVLKRPAYICHCCSCCCGALKPTRGYGLFFAHPSNFLPALAGEHCIGCGLCVKKCPVAAISLRDAEGGGKTPWINQLKCLGCGVCAAACSQGSLTMSRRPVLHVPPKNKSEQLTCIAKEKGKWQP